MHAYLWAILTMAQTATADANPNNTKKGNTLKLSAI